jgi:hypothetical protein
MTTDFFSATFLFSVLVIMLVGGIFVYVNYKMSEQDHKLSSMVSLVSMLAQDLQFIKNKVNMSQPHVESNNLQYQSQLVGGENKIELIDVSDGEDEEDEEDEQDEQDDYDENEEDDYDENDEDDYDENEEDDDNEEEDDNEEDDTHKRIQLLNLTLVNNDVDSNFDNELHIEELDVHESSNTDNIKTIHIEDTEVVENLMELKESESDTNNNVEINSEELSFLKNVSISDLGDIQDLHESKTEYKKMSLNKLREVVVGKGVVSDASKLKKNDILKMLGDE